MEKRIAVVVLVVAILAAVGMGMVLWMKHDKFWRIFSILIILPTAVSLLWLLWNINDFFEIAEE